MKDPILEKLFPGVKWWDIINPCENCEENVTEEDCITYCVYGKLWNMYEEKGEKK